MHRLTRSLPLAILAGSVTASSAGQAEDTSRLHHAAHGWFDGERQSGYLWGGFGLASLGAAGGLWRAGKGSDVERGMAYPMGAFGLLQAIIGVGSLARGDERDSRFDASLARSPEQTRLDELARMRTVNGFFLAIEVVEVAVVAGGSALAATRGEGQELARGVGLGLAIEGGSMLFLDALAAARAHGYAGQLGSLSFTARVAPGGASLVGSF